MNRRDLLAAAPAVALAACVPVAASASALSADVSPIAEMHREITRLQEMLNGESTLTEVEADRISRRMMELADAIADLPARNADDMLCKIMGQTVNGDHEVGDGPGSQAIWAEARALIGGAA